jgi:hypothetical protein
MTINTRTAAGSLRLDDLQQRIRDTEDDLGVLRNIGLTDAGNNRLIFDDSELPDDQRRTTLQIVADHPPVIPGSTLVCSGPTFIEGSLQQVAVYR